MIGQDIISMDIPSTGIPAFGDGPKLAMSTYLQSDVPREIEVRSVRVDISRKGTLQSAVSDHLSELPLHSSVVETVSVSYLQPQLVAVEKNPNNSGARVSAAMLLLALGRCEEAVVLLKSDTTGDYWIKHYLAVSYARLGNATQAISMFGELAVGRPNDARPLHALGRAHIEASDWPAAELALAEAVKCPDVTAAMFNDYAAVSMQKGDAQTALRRLRSALRIDPAYALALNNMGVCYLLQQDKARAKRYFAEAYKVDAKCAPVVHNLAELAIDEGAFQAAIDLLESHLRFEPGDRHAGERLSWSYYRVGRLNEAIEAMSKLGADNGPAMNNLALFHAKKKDWLQSITLFERAVLLEPEDPIIRRNFAQLLVALRKWEEVSDVLDARRVRGVVQDVRLLANALTSRSRFADAVALLRENVDLFAQDPALPISLGYLLASRLHLPEEAIDVLRHARVVHPESQMLANNLAYAMLQADRSREARDVLEPVVSALGSPRTPAESCLLATWGLLLIREGRYREGMEFYQAARADASGDLAVRLKQKVLVEEGRHLLMEGRREPAMKKLQHALQLPDEEFRGEARHLMGQGGLAN